MTGNKSLTVHLQNLDKITNLSDSIKNIDSIDEENIQSPNHINDDLYGVM